MFPIQYIFVSYDSQNVRGSNPGEDEIFPQVSFQQVKQPGRGVNHQRPSRTEVKERVELYLYFPLGLNGLFYGETYLFYF